MTTARAKFRNPLATFACAGVFAVIVSACQTLPPTKTVEKDDRDLSQVVEKAKKPIVLTENTVILDTRSNFDFGLNHIPNSRNLTWESLAEDSRATEPMRDHRKAAMRLALLGLTPQTPVVIVGYGQNGHGEEGRLALDLLALGFQDVQVSSVEAFRKSMSPNENPPVLNEKPWEPRPRGDLRVSKQEFERFAESKAAREQNRVRLIDVRSSKEFYGEKHEVGAANLEWKNFYTDQGRPDPAVKAKLQALGVQPGDRVILLCKSGVRSSAATYALRALGFEQAQTLAGGFNGLEK